jgi:hypothetical protein
MGKMAFYQFPELLVYSLMSLQNIAALHACMHLSCVECSYCNLWLFLSHSSAKFAPQTPLSSHGCAGD